MAERGNDLPETPENWGEYSRMLGELPERSLPSGADGRLQARLARAIAFPRPDRRWLIGGLSLAGTCLAIAAALTIASPDAPPAFKAPARPTVVNEEKSKRRHHRRPQPPRPIAPQVSEHSVPIDTNIPPHIQLEPRQPEVITGERRAPGQ